ncbi:hypothetical protein B0H14DRAFT_2564631 [Mycena olivaceomarginata]|nr:hypothetical protein B0H14DRAFT_2564631 [Mycena olivaceomarginata]
MFKLALCDEELPSAQELIECSCGREAADQSLVSFKDRIAKWQKSPRTSYKVGKEAIKTAEFLDRDLKIQDTQRKLKNLIRDTAEHELQAWKKEILSRTSKLRDQISTSCGSGCASRRA